MASEADSSTGKRTRRRRRRRDHEGPFLPPTMADILDSVHACTRPTPLAWAPEGLPPLLAGVMLLYPGTLTKQGWLTALAARLQYMIDLLHPEQVIALAVESGATPTFPRQPRTKWGQLLLLLPEIELTLEKVIQDWPVEVTESNMDLDTLVKARSLDCWLTGMWLEKNFDDIFEEALANPTNATSSVPDPSMSADEAKAVEWGAEGLKKLFGPDSGRN
jgi:hypothetical protein